MMVENTADYSPATERKLAFTDKEREELRQAKAIPISFDEDCPETTPERALKFKRVNPVWKAAQ